MFHPDKHVYEYRIQTSRDVEARGNTQVWIDADSGHVISIDYPTGAARGNTFTTWIQALHEAMVGGLAYKVAVTAFGFLVANFSITGVISWIKKRKSAAIARRIAARS